MKSPEEIVHNMFQNDSYSQWLGIVVVSVHLGECTLKMCVREEMLNGHEILHGGISYALSDSSLAFASNSRGNKCVSIETTISHIAKAQLGDILTAHCTEINCGKTVARYQTKVFNQHQKLIAQFYGTVHRSTETW